METDCPTHAAPVFDVAFRGQLTDLMRWRRDVRRFRTDPVDPATLEDCLRSFALAPSVGLSEPWRIVRMTSAAARSLACRNFEAANRAALAGYDGDKARLYAGLKLTGMQEAPVQLAIFCDEGTEKGAGLGAATMPETRAYSVVTAISYFWLALRAHGLGLGWVSILDPGQLSRDLAMPAGWRFVAYLCVGYPEAEAMTPELARAGWEKRAPDLTILER